MPDSVSSLVHIGIDMREFIEDLSKLLLDGEECPEDCECGSDENGHEVSTDDAFDDRTWAVDKARALVARMRALGG